MDHKLVSEDQHKFVVRHPKGHDITIAKAGLQSAVISKIKKLPAVKMADGGVIGEASDRAEANVNDYMDHLNAGQGDDAPSLSDVGDAVNNGAQAINTLADNAHDYLFGSGAQSGTPEAAPAQIGDPQFVGPTQPDQAGPAIPAASDRSPASAAPAAASGASFPDPLKTLQQSQALQTAGIQGMAKAKGAESDQQAKAYQDYLDQQKAITAQYNQKYQQLDAENANFQKAYADGKIEPNRLWHNASTGNKILASIGLILGGAGSGSTGHNQALEVMQKNIDRDIDAQKANMDKNRNLFSMNMERYRNTQLAENATRLQMNQALQAQVQMAAAKSGSAQAQANAQIMIGQLKQQQVPLQISIAQQQVHNTLAGAGGGQGGLPVNQAPGYVLTDPKTVQVGDRVYQARDPKEASELRTMQANYKPVVNGLQMLDRLGPSAAIPGTAASAQADSIKHALMFKINELYGLKRLSEPDMKALTAEIDNPNSFKQMLTKGVRNSTFKRILDDSIDSAYSTKLPGYRGLSSISSRGQGFK